MQFDMATHTQAGIQMHIQSTTYTPNFFFNQRGRANSMMRVSVCPSVMSLYSYKLWDCHSSAGIDL